MSVDFSFDQNKCITQITSFIKKSVEKAGFSNVVLGLSGGIDSALSCILATKAVGHERVHVVLLPYGEKGHEAKNDALLVTSFAEIPPEHIHIIDIEPIIKAFLNAQSDTTAIRTGNMMARTRMVLLFDIAKKINGLVLGTENKSEHLLGYFTRFGDEASDIEPIRFLYKTQIRMLGAHVKLPKKILDKPPTADLWNGQTDENELGFSYEDADAILHLYFDKKIKKEEIEKEGFKKDQIEKVLKRASQNAFKHTLPFVLI